MNLPEIRSGLATPFSPTGKAAIREAVSKYGYLRGDCRIIPTKAYNDYGDGIITDFALNTKTGDLSVSLTSFGDGVDNDGCAGLDAFISAALGRGYDFSWREERLRYTHTVTTTFGEDSLREAIKQMLDYITPEAIEKRSAVYDAVNRLKRLVEGPVREEYKDRTGGLDWAYWRRRQAMWEAAENNAAALKAMDDKAFCRYLRHVFNNAV